MTFFRNKNKKKKSKYNNQILGGLFLVVKIIAERVSKYIKVVAQKIYSNVKFLKTKNKKNKEEWKKLEILTREVKKGKIRDVKILERIILKLYEFHKKNQKKVAFFSIFSLIIIFLTTITSGLITSLIFPRIFNSSAASYTWQQTSWQGGATENSAAHPDDQVGWTEYQEKDTSLVANTELSLSQLASSSLQTSDGDFNTGVLSDVMISGTGNDSSLTLGINSAMDWASTHLVSSYDTPGYANETFISGNYAYVADTSGGLQILDITDPYHPTLAKNYTTGLGSTKSVVIRQNYAYIGDYFNGFFILNVSDPSNPSQVGFVGGTLAANDVEISGDYAYLADGSAGLRVISIADLAHPSSVATCDTPGSAKSLRVSGNYAYVADSDYGLQVIDISNPLTPNLVGTYNTPGNANGIDVSGIYAYVADDSYGLQIFNISDPLHPSLAFIYDTPGAAYNAYISGDYLYLSDYNTGVQILNIANPVSPVLLAFFNTPNYTRSVVAAGNYAYVSDANSGLQIIDITNPLAPNLTGAYDTAGSARKTYTSGNYAYIADYNSGLLILDISNPASPTLSGSISTGGNAYDVQVRGSYAYVAAYTAGLRIIDISDPAHPSITGSYDTAGYAYGVYIEGNYAYIADGTAGLQVIDISAPANPILVGTCDTPNNANDLYVSGNYVYVADYISGLQIINISEPSHPTIVGTYNTSGIATDVLLSGNYAYVSDNSSGVQIVDISTPETPAFVAVYDTPGAVESLFISNNYAYVADHAGGLQIIDISNFFDISLKGYYYTGNNTYGVFVSGKYVYLADDTAGVKILSTGSYKSSGTYTSESIDTGQNNNSWGNISWNTTISSNTQIVLKVKSSTTSPVNGVEDCTALVTINFTNQSGTQALEGNSCINVGDRFIVYFLIFSTSDNANTPSVADLNIAYNFYSNSQSLISSPYDSSDIANVLGKIEWTEATPQGTDVKFQLRTADTEAGLASAEWLGPTDTDDYYLSAAGLETINSTHRTGLNDKWLQYKAYLESDGIDTPTLSQVTLTYVVNAAPEVRNVTAAQSSNGNVIITYEVRDIDTNTGLPANQGHITPSFQYWNGAAWDDCSVASGDTDNKSVNTETPAEYTAYSATWTPVSDFPNHYMGNLAKVRVTIDDKEMANNTDTTESGTFTLDTLAPQSASIKIDARVSPANLTLAATDDSSMEMKISLTQGGGNWEPFATSGNINLETAPDTVYAQFIDAYGNITNANATIPQTPEEMIVRDITNLDSADHQLFVAWKMIDLPAQGFKNYKVYKSEDNVTYALASTITNRSLNYYADFNLKSDQMYYYKVTAEDNGDNISSYSAVVSDIPNGQGGTDSTGPTISNVATTSVSTTEAIITWDTDELSNSTVGYSTTPGNFTSEKGVATMLDNNDGIGKHMVTLTGLLPNQTYYFRVKSTDPSENTAISTQGLDGYMFTTLQGATISNVEAASIANNSVTITWTTDIDSSSSVVYSANSDLSDPTEKSNSALTQTHSINLTALSQNLNYYYYVKSSANESEAMDTNGGDYYSFKTTSDISGPLIASPSAGMLTDTKAVISWTTDEPSTSFIEYGTVSNIYSFSANKNANLDLSHSVILSNLSEKTKYYYKVVSADQSGNTSTSTEKDFTTLEKLSTETEVTQREETASGQGGGVLIIDKTDKIPPTISNVKVSELKFDSVVIEWSTNEPANSFIEYGSTTDYGDTYGSYNSVLKHSVNIKNLELATTYHFKVLSSDSWGNLSESNDMTFTTIRENDSIINDKLLDIEKDGNTAKASITDELEGIEKDKNQLENHISGSDEETVMRASVVARKAMDIINKFASQVSISTMEKTVNSQLEALTKIAEVIPAPLMTSEPKVITTATTATISWRTDKQSNSLVAFSSDDYFKTANKENLYIQEVGLRDEKTNEHAVNIYELKPDTKYHYKIKSKADIGPIAESSDFTFQTKSESLEISNFNLEIISPEKAVFKWLTNVETDTQAKYIPYRNNVLMIEEERTINDGAMSISHEMTIEDFESGIIYNLEFSGKDLSGRSVTKSVPTFSTSKDDFAPVISQVQTESAISPGKDDKIQTIISWLTNEPSTGRVYYEKGISANEKMAEKTQIDNNLSKKHVIIITKFDPGTVYRFKVESIDSGGNMSLSNAFSILTPQQKQSVFQIIMSNIEKTFGWMGKINK